MATYIVKAGDTLSKIGQQFGVDYNKITGYASGNPNLIRPGEVLTIPDKVPVAPVVAPAPAPAPVVAPAPTPQLTPQPTQPPTPAPTPAPATVSTYQVNPGDTVNAIAAKLGVTPDKISGFRSGNANLIYPGETLTIGGGTSGESPTPAAPVDPQAQKEASVKQLITQAAKLGLDFPKEAVDAILGNTGKTKEQIQQEVYDKYGISDLEKKFSERPTQTYEEIYTKAFTDLGLADLRANIDALNKKLTDMESAANEDYANINDNPWHTEASRLGDMKRASEKWDRKMGLLQNQFTIAQNTYDRGKTEASDAATRALNTFNQEREWTKEELTILENRAEADISAQVATQEENKASETFRYYPQYLGSVVPKSTISSSGNSTVKTNTIDTNYERIVRGIGNINDLTPTDKTAVLNKLYTDGFYEDNPPKWFIDQIESQLKQSLVPAKQKQLWDEYRNPIIERAKSTKSTSGATDYGSLNLAPAVQ